MAKFSDTLLVRVHYSILALCYLEVLLWTSCLVASLAVAPAVGISDSHQYLLRETDNLNFAASLSQPHYLPASIDLRGFNLQREKELVALQRLAEANWSVIPTRLQPVEGFNISVHIVTGVPAPFTGVKAISDHLA